MKSWSLYTGLFALAVTFAGPVGCAAEASDDAADDSAEDDLTAGPSKSKLLGEVFAIKVNDTTIGSKTKVAAILNAMDIGSRDAIPAIATSMPRCMLSHPTSFIGAKGKVIATAGFMCGSEETTGTATAFVTYGSKTYTVKADLGGVFKQVQKPTQAGDLLYGITSVSIAKPGPGTTSRASTETQASITSVLGSIGQAVTLVDPNAPQPRCIPARVITFYRGATEAATLTSMCSGSSGMSTGTLFTAEDSKLGKVDLDLTKLSKVEATLRWSR